jgi:hypothetical protein
MMNRLYALYLGSGRGIRFTHGALLGGWAIGAVLLFLGAPERPTLNRLLIAAFGGAMLVAFWLWIGALLGYAWAQHRHERAKRGSGPADQS